MPAIVMPSHGRFVGASSLPFSEYKRQPGDRLGSTGGSPTSRARRAVRHVVFDTNYWKSFVHARLAVPMGDRGCLSLFGDQPEQHRLFAEHLTAEYRVKTEGRGRTVDEWKLRPGAPTTTGSTAWSAAPWPPRCRASPWQAWRNIRPSPSANGRRSRNSQVRRSWSVMVEFLRNGLRFTPTARILPTILESSRTAQSLAWRAALDRYRARKVACEAGAPRPVGIRLRVKT